MFNMRKVLTIVLTGFICVSSIFNSKIYATGEFTIPDKYYIGDNLDILNSTDEDYYESLGKKLSTKKIDLVLLHFKESVVDPAIDTEEIYYKYLNTMSIGQELVLITYFDATQTLTIKDDGILKSGDKNKIEKIFNKYIKDDRVAEGLDYLYKATAKTLNDRNDFNISDINKIELSKEYEKSTLINTETILIALIVLTLSLGLRKRK